MKTAYDIIIKPVITEQSMEATEDKKYVFQVAIDANKVEIKKAELFKEAAVVGDGEAPFMVVIVDIVCRGGAPA